MFKKFKYFFTEFLDDSISDQENYENLCINKKEEEKPYILLIKSSGSNWNKCQFCNSNCNSCEFAYDENLTLQDILNKIKDNSRLELDLFV